MDLTEFLSGLGLASAGWIKFLNFTINMAGLLLLAWICYLIVSKLVARIVSSITSRTSFKWDEILLNRQVFQRLGWLVAAIVVTIGLREIYFHVPKVLIQAFATCVVIAAVMVVSAFLNGVNALYETYSVSKDRPIKVIIQVLMIFVWFVALMVVVSIFTEKDITVLIGGLTAFAAVLMLIFQDSILGFVAGIQLSANHMVRVGDWIVMPGRGVDGDVTEINLTTVKVQNFDKTITTVPTHKLVTESFTNWRGMEESKGRRIKRSVNIDVNSIHYLTDQEIERMKQSRLLNEYITKKKDEIDRFNAQQTTDLDARHLTNIGTFREYLESWLASNPNINQEMTHMVRQLQPGPTGLPLEIYCFSAKQAWIDYENVQSDVFDHVYAVIGLFGLRPFQYTGAIPPQEVN